jgi:selenide, water dikinase
MAPGDLDRALCGLDFPSDENVIVGLTSADDAGVYRISDDLALIQTVDFFTPIVDDPYMFGQIAAANALSDVYAMGGIPKTAMNLVAFPAKDMDLSILRQIIQGGIDKIREAGVVLLGGHSIEDKELKYGLSVTGFIHPDKILTKKNFRLGDRLILTKPLGTGVINTAIKAGLASAETVERVSRQMAALNKDAARVMADFSVHACTDVTGFGLIGHLAEMVEKSKLSVRIDTRNVPLITDAMEYASMGLIPAGAYKNREFREAMVQRGSGVQQTIEDFLYDPQTSGGLLICVDGAQADQLVDALQSAGIDAASVIAEVVEGVEEKIYLK